VIIRSKTVHDYAAIADLNARAFGNRATEPLVVTLLRHRAVFDPELSLVAEDQDGIVGHVLFSPHTVRLLDQDVRAVNLAPIAVDPARQKQGIGGRLIEEGHRRAAAKGYALSFLLGHTSYYPRFGYQTGAFGASQVMVPVEALSVTLLEERPPTPKDVPALQALRRRAEAGVDFALDPGPYWLDWISPNPAIVARVYCSGSDVVGYTRVHSAEPASPRVFFARDGEMSRAIAAAVAQSAGPETKQVVLPLHPAAAAGFDTPECKAWAAAMAVPLAAGPLEEYLALVRAQRRLPGCLVWPVAFDL
jgi:putative acetyltransferase